MNFNGIIVLLNLIIVAIADYPVRRKPFCLVEKNQYYHKQQPNRCRLCDKCHVGERTNLTATVEMSKMYGALKCRPCVPCPTGMYNTRRAFKCKPCKDCAASGRTVKIACAPKRKEVCGKRIKVNTSSTTDPTHVLSTVHHPPDDHPPGGRHLSGNQHPPGDHPPGDRHPPSDRPRDRTVGNDYQGDGHTVLNNHTHINIPAAALAISVILAVGIVLVGVTYTCCRGKRDCSLRPTNIIADCQPIMVRPGSEHTSIVSGITPYIRPKPVNDNSCSDRTYGYMQHRSDQDGRTSHPTYSREHGSYIAIRQEEYPSSFQTRHVEHSYELSSDVEEDAVPSIVMINENSDSTDRADAVRYTTAPTHTEELPDNDAMYYEQASAALPKNKSENNNTSYEGKRKKDQTGLNRFIEIVSRYIAPNDTYQSLGRHLNVSSTDIDTIREDFTTIKERAYRTLQRWRQCNPKANIDDLKQGICDIGRKDILDKIQS